VQISSFASPFAPLDDVCIELTRKVCPLFVLTAPRRPFLIGTGIPLQIGGLSVIVTAAHVLAGVGGASVLTFGDNRAFVLRGERRGFGHTPGRFVDVDLAVIVLSESERDELRRHFDFSFSHEYTPTPDPGEIAFYGVVGYPHSRNKLSPRLLRSPHAVATYFITRKRVPLEHVKSKDKFPSVHFALGAREKGAVGKYGQRVSLPSPSGLSGCGVWWLDLPDSFTRVPTPKLVGVGIEYCRRPGAFVCTRIANVDVMVKDITT
jgi:hypothetical protein